MKKTRTLMLMLALLCISTVSSYAQQKTNPEAVKKLQQFYNSLGPKHEISFDQFLEYNSRTANAQATTNGLYDGCISLNKICDNSDFESGLDTSAWGGAYGQWGSGDPDPTTLTQGFISGDLFDFNAHQTIVSTDVDPIVGISTTNSLNPSSTKALRIGNAINNYGTEMISKTITVKSGQTIIPFYYAVVFEDPQHAPQDQPWFSVRVFDCATGQEITGVCDLGNGSNHVVSDRTNPFFNCSSTSGCNVLYRDWTRTEINLSAYIGKKVNIQFLNKDCGLGGHYGYTYIDDFASGICGAPPPPPPFGIIRNLSQSDTCGIGQICVDYKAPVDTSNGVVGDVNIDLNIYQNGSLIQTLTSGTQSQDSGTYCFSINPVLLSIDTSLGAFDYTLTGHFSLENFPQSPQTIGNPPDGQVLGFNNDYYVTTCPVIGKDNAPVFVYPPTPADGNTINVHPGEKVMFTVKAKDNDAGDMAMLSVNGLPGGATTIPALPSSGNPVSTKFMWTPSAGDVGTYPIQFIATDDSGKTAMTTVIVQVTSVSCGDTSFRPFVYAYPAYTVANQAAHTIYKGYGTQHVTLVAVPRGGSGNPLHYKFKWDNGSQLPVRIVSPNVTTQYDVDITDGKGCMAHATIIIRVVDVRCGKNNDKVEVCVGNHMLCVDSSAVNALIRGGAKLGSCGMMRQAAPATALRTAVIPESLKAVQQSSFTAYPNPASSTIRFKWDMNVTGNTKINIVDLQGRVVVTQSVTSAGQSINIGKLSNGVYMAQLMVDGKQAGITRFTVSK